ncbi:MAG: hypothetical protein JWM98_2224 [Thermoleophilia bacterium]|nr:hypothetical protein [Thermoleophilia bacterium]
MLILHPGPTREGAFTLVELVVAMVIGTIVFGIGALVASSLFVGGAHSNATRLANGEASTVLERFERDVRFAQSPDVLDHPRSGDDLRGLLLWGQSLDDSGNPIVTTPDQCSASLAYASRDFCRFEDITVASATELWVRSDVRNATAADDGVECVRWEVRNGALWRSVNSAGPEPDCRRIGGTKRLGRLVEDEEMLAAPASGSGTGNVEGRAASFGYLIVWNPRAAGTPTGSIVDPTTCTTQQTSYTNGPTGRQRTFITTATLDLAANTHASQGAAARSRYAVSASLMGRQNDEYVRAAGCAY